MGRPQWPDSMNPDSIDPMSTPGEVVLFVHGTGASDPQDRGTRWWQTGSSFRERLQRAVGSEIDCRSERSAFHWNGLNSESSRREAGRRLLADLWRLEDQGTYYHLVGHSHGGSVIWHALCEGERAGRPLSHLRSWVSVGTPFLRFRSFPPTVAVALPLVSAVVGVHRSFDQWPVWRSAVDETVWAQSKHAEALVFPPTFFAISSISLLACVALIGGALAACWRHNRQCAYESAAHERYRGRYLALWAGEDEALAGLRLSLGLDGAIIYRPRLRSRILRVISSPFTWAYGVGFAGPADEFIWSRTTRRLQGNDLSWLSLSDVHPTPNGWPADNGMSPEAQAKLTDVANQQAARTLANLRRTIGLATEEATQHQGLVASLTPTITWSELIHNGYFDSPAVVESIANHLIHCRSSLIPAKSDAAVWQPEPTTTQNRSVRGRSASRLAHALLAVALVVTVVAATVVHRVIVSPLSADGQIDQIISEARLDETLALTRRMQDVFPWLDAIAAARGVETALAIARSHFCLSGGALLAHLAHTIGATGDYVRARALMQEALDREYECNINDSVVPPDVSDGGLERELVHFGLKDAVEDRLGSPEDSADEFVAIALGFICLNDPAGAVERFLLLGDGALHKSYLSRFVDGIRSAGLQVPLTLFETLAARIAQLPSDGLRRSALNTLVEEVLRDRQFGLAGVLARNAMSPSERVRLLSIVARRTPDMVEKASILGEVKLILDERSRPVDRNASMALRSTLAQVQLALADDPQARKALQSVAEPTGHNMPSRDDVELYVATALRLGEPRWALQMASGLFDYWPEEDAALARQLAAIVRRVPLSLVDSLEPDKLGAGLETIERIRLLTALAPFVPTDLSVAYLEQSRREADLLPVPLHRSVARRWIAEVWIAKRNHLAASEALLGIDTDQRLVGRIMLLNSLGSRSARRLAQ